MLSDDFQHLFEESCFIKRKIL